MCSVYNHIMKWFQAGFDRNRAAAFNLIDLAEKITCSSLLHCFNVRWLFCSQECNTSYIDNCSSETSWADCFVFIFVFGKQMERNWKCFDVHGSNIILNFFHVNVHLRGTRNSAVQLRCGPACCVLEERHFTLTCYSRPGYINVYRLRLGR